MGKNELTNKRKIKRNPTTAFDIASDVKARKKAEILKREREEDRALQREQIEAAEVKYYQDQLNAGDERVEDLKGQIVTTKRANNTTRVGALAAVAAGTLATNLTILQGSETTTDSILKYGIVIGACIAGLLMNNHFNKTDITMTEMLKRANAWSRQDFTPEEVQTFKELYDEVKSDFEENPKLKKDVKSNFIFQTSQGVIFALAVACVASGADKIGYNIDRLLSANDEENKNYLTIDLNDPMLNSGKNLRFPDFD